VGRIPAAMVEALLAARAVPQILAVVAAAVLVTRGVALPLAALAVPVSSSCVM
jgi:hypothetical protein